MTTARRTWCGLRLKTNRPPALHLRPDAGEAGGEAQAGRIDSRPVEDAAISADQVAPLQGGGVVGAAIEVTHQGVQAGHRQQHAQPLAVGAVEGTGNDQARRSAGWKDHWRHPLLPGGQSQPCADAQRQGVGQQRWSAVADLLENAAAAIDHRQLPVALIADQLGVQHLPQALLVPQTRDVLEVGRRHAGVSGDLLQGGLHTQAAPEQG
jgi:hypothetical protein